jgi:pilus assembly protein CpaE
VTGRYSTLDALINVHRLDQTYLTALMVEHSVGLSILAAPGMHTQVQIIEGATKKLLTTAGRSFNQVVVDAGSHWSWIDAALFDRLRRFTS